MPQSLIQLPKDADFRILEHRIIIRDYRIQSGNGLFDMILYIVDGFSSDRQTLHQLEEHGISWEMAIEWCAWELEDQEQLVGDLICWSYNIDEILREEDLFKKITVFSRSDAGRALAYQFIEKIRSCDNWGELYDELQLSSKFQKDMKSRMIMGLRQQPYNKVKKKKSRK